MHVSRTISALAASVLLLALGSGAAMAQKKNDTGATDTEIRIGNIAPYSGPASAYATIAKTEAAYFKMINEQGGINGRKINFISYDDGYSPPKGRPEEPALEHGLAAELSERSAHLRPLHPEELPRQDGRHPLSERRLR
jgi:hypothetical protein